MKVPFRQGIVSYQTDADGTMQFLTSASSGVSLYVFPSPTIVNFAHGSANYLFTETRSVPNAWPGPFSNTQDTWLYWDLNLKTGVRTFGSTTIAPINSAAAPNKPVVGQHWFDTTNTTMYEWVGVWNPVIRVFAAKYQRGSTFLSMSTAANNGMSFSGSQVSNRQSVTAGALIFDGSGTPLKSSNGTFFTTADAFVTGVNTSASVKLESIVLEGIADESIPAFSAVYFSDFDHIRLANQYSAVNKVVGIVQEDAYRTKVVQIVTNGVVVNPNWRWSTANKLLYVNSTGKVVDAPTIAKQVPFAMVVNPTTILVQIPSSVNVGPEGPQGPQGPVGPGGEGSVGPTGPQGPVGDAGPVGPQGLRGPAGPAGPQGNQGTQGAVGPASTVPGPQGPIGPAGPQGVEGPAGTSGVAGPKGDKGDAGATGSVGPAGAKGDIGLTGPAGDKGDIGLTGPAGAKGDKGDAGPAGADSTVPGPAGATGPAGDKGDKGDAGPASTIPGPAGETGPAGAKGDKGDAGPAGADSTVPGPAGATGPAGDKGDKGDAGPASTVPGPAGETGPQGLQGPQGEVGPQGPKGDPGSGGGATQLSELTDVEGVPVDGYALAFNGTTNKWEPKLISGGGGGDPVSVGDTYNTISKYVVEATPGIAVTMSSSSTVYANLTWARVGTTLTITKANHGRSVGDRVIVRNTNVDLQVALVAAVAAGTFSIVCANTGGVSGKMGAYSLGFTFAHNGAAGSITGGAITAPANANVVLLGVRMHLTANSRSANTYTLTVPASMDNGAGTNTGFDDIWIPMHAVKQDVNNLTAVNVTIAVNPGGAGYNVVQLIALPIVATGIIVQLQY